jgi:hypothetical protein
VRLVRLLKMPGWLSGVKASYRGDGRTLPALAQTFLSEARCRNIIRWMRLAPAINPHITPPCHQHTVQPHRCSLLVHLTPQLVSSFDGAEAARPLTVVQASINARPSSVIVTMATVEPPPRVPAGSTQPSRVRFPQCKFHLRGRPSRGIVLCIRVRKLRCSDSVWRIGRPTGSVINAVHQQSLQRPEVL